MHPYLYMYVDTVFSWLLCKVTIKSGTALKVSMTISSEGRGYLVRTLVSSLMTSG